MPKPRRRELAVKCSCCDVGGFWLRVVCARQVCVAGRHLKTQLRVAQDIVLDRVNPALDYKRVRDCAWQAEGILGLIQETVFGDALAEKWRSDLATIVTELYELGAASVQTEPHAKVASRIDQIVSALDRLLTEAQESLKTYRQNPIYWASGGRASGRNRSRSARLLAAEALPKSALNSQPVAMEQPSASDQAMPMHNHEFQTVFNILVLGDLHVGADGTAFAWNGVQGHFLRDLGKLEERIGAEWDVVAFVGDAVAKGKESEFDRFSEILDSLWDRWKKNGWHPKLVAVPGNHDLERPEKQTGTVKTLLRFEQDVEVRRDVFTQGENEYRNEIKKRFQEYDKWWKKQRDKGRWPEGLKEGCLPGDFCVTIQEPKGGKKLGIMGLNSSFLHLQDVTEANPQLWIDEAQFDLAGGAPWCESNDVSCLLTHHPSSWLHKYSQRQYNNCIYTSANFAVHLCGHAHKARSRFASEQGLPERKFIVNNSLFGRMTFGKGENEEKRIHGYTAVQLLFDGANWFCSFFPRCADELKEWRLSTDPSFYSEDNSDCVGPAIIRR